MATAAPGEGRLVPRTEPLARRDVLRREGRAMDAGLVGTEGPELVQVVEYTFLLAEFIILQIIHRKLKIKMMKRENL